MLHYGYANTTTTNYFLKLKPFVIPHWPPITHRIFHLPGKERHRMNPTFRLSTFIQVDDNQPKEITRSWPQLLSRFAKPEIRAEKDGALFSPAVFEPRRRLKENVRELSLLVLDRSEEHTSELQSLRHLVCRL